MVKTLSAKQQQIIRFIRRFRKKQDFPPTVREIVSGCGISSTSVVSYNLDILEKQGYIRRHREVSRGIELLQRGDIGGERRLIPVIGQIAAGQPIPVPAPDTWNVTTMDTIEVTDDLIRGKEDVYALRVKGTSMIDALINDGDIVLMQPAASVENGETAAVWLKAEKEVTLKKVFAERERIRLQPANSSMKPIFTSLSNLEIQGRLLAVIRQVA
ncbi:MAG: transcriptional repressor LexA [Chloroflexota bacterium]